VSCVNQVFWNHRRNQDFLWRSAHSSSKKLTTFLLVSLEVGLHAKTAESPLSKSPPPSKNVLINLTLALPGGALQLSPVNYAPSFIFLRAVLWSAREPSAPPGYVYVWND